MKYSIGLFKSEDGGEDYLDKIRAEGLPEETATKTQEVKSKTVELPAGFHGGLDPFTGYRTSGNASDEGFWDDVNLDVMYKRWFMWRTPKLWEIGYKTSPLVQRIIEKLTLDILQKPASVIDDFYVKRSLYNTIKTILIYNQGGLLLLSDKTEDDKAKPIFSKLKQAWGEDEQFTRVVELSFGSVKDETIAPSYSSSDIEKTGYYLLTTSNTASDNGIISGKNGLINDGKKEVKIHPSRVIWVQRGGISYVGKIALACKNYENAALALGKMISNQARPIFKMNNLKSVLANNGNDNRFTERINQIAKSASLTVIDMEKEDYSVIETSYGGIAVPLEELKTYLSAVSGIPKTMITGETTGGFQNSDNLSLVNYSQKKASMYEEGAKPVVVPLLDKLGLKHEQVDFEEEAENFIQRGEKNNGDENKPNESSAKKTNNSK